MGFVRHALTGVLRGDVGLPPPEEDLIADWQMDGLEMAELRIATEEVFGVRIDPSEWEKVRTIKDAVDLVDRLRTT